MGQGLNQPRSGGLVADGMGGMAAGEVASSSALCKLVELVVNTPDWIMRLDQSEDSAIVLDRNYLAGLARYCYISLR